MILLWPNLDNVDVQVLYSAATKGRLDNRLGEYQSILDYCTDLSYLLNEMKCMFFYSFIDYMINHRQVNTGNVDS